MFEDSSDRMGEVERHRVEVEEEELKVEDDSNALLIGFLLEFLKLDEIENILQRSKNAFNAVRLID